MFSKTSDKVSMDERLGRYDHLVVHCTATPPSVKVDAAWVDRVHRKRGFRMCGYNAVVAGDGGWQDSDDGYFTRPIGQQGAHVGDCGPGWNGRSFGVSLAGGVDEDNRPDCNFTPVQMSTLQAGIETFLALHPNPSSVVVLGHRDLIAQTHASPKACPCFDVQKWMHDRSIDPDNLLNLSSADADEDSLTPTGPLSTPRTYEVRGGDTLWAISQRFGVTLEDLRIFNLLGNSAMIRPGQVLQLWR